MVLKADPGALSIRVPQALLAHLAAAAPPSSLEKHRQITIAF